MRDVIGCNGSQASARSSKLSNYRLWVRFDDGVEGEVDQHDTVVWENLFDVAPEISAHICGRAPAPVSHANLLIRVTEFVPDLTVGHRDDSSAFEFLQ